MKRNSQRQAHRDTDLETHSKTLGRAPEILLKRERKDWRIQEDQGNHNKAHRINLARLIGAHRD